MTAWAVITDENQVLPITILCGEHVHDPAVLNRYWTALKIDGLFPEEASPNWVQLAPEDNHLEDHCVECARDAGFSQPDLPTKQSFPSLTSQLLIQLDPEQSDLAVEAEQDPGEVHREMNAVLPVPRFPELIDKESLNAEYVSVGYSEDMVTMELTVREVVLYPATVIIPKRRYEETLALFPHLKRNDLPVGLILRIAEQEDARVVVDKGHGDVQGQTPEGPVAEGETVESE